jgi:hypothetical protein
VLTAAEPVKSAEYEVVVTGVRLIGVFADATAEEISSAAARMVDLKFIRFS